jgi:hypothetical protein
LGGIPVAPGAQVAHQRERVVERRFIFGFCHMKSEV